MHRSHFGKTVGLLLLFCLVFSGFGVLTPSISHADVKSPLPPGQSPGHHIPKKKLLHLEARKAVSFFWNEANTDPSSPGYGLTAKGTDDPGVSSVASVGFGLTALTIGAENHWIPRKEARKRALGTLNTLLHNADQVHGFFYHWLDIKTGKRTWNSEVSSIDTVLALNGVITAGEYFGGDVKKLADQIYDRVDWPWFRDSENNQFYMAWRPETGFSPGTWNNYAEQLDMYVLAAGSPTHPVNKDMFYSFKRRKSAYKDGQPFIYSWFGSLFTYQYAHAWVDFRNKVDRKGVDWFQNSVIASKASRQYSIDHADQYKTFGPDSWGLTASKGPNGYKGYGSPPSGEPGVNNQNSTDGTIAPAGAAGSIVFTPKASIAAMENYYENYPKLWGKYGFKGAYNLDVSPAWYSNGFTAINKGISLLMIENYESGFVWKWYMRNEAVQKGIKAIGLTGKVTPANVRDVSAKWRDGTASISWIQPKGKMQQSDYQSVYIYNQNGKKLAGPVTIKKGKTRYTITGLTNGKKYSFRIVRMKNGVSSNGVTVSGIPGKKEGK